MRLEIRGDYPEAWPEIAARVKAEAGNRCIRCRHPAETATHRVPCDELCLRHDWRKQRMLTVHHLDGDKSNCRWWNLLALCQVCHLQI